jgi:hypothetical protein
MTGIVLHLELRIRAERVAGEVDFPDIVEESALPGPSEEDRTVPSCIEYEAELLSRGNVRYSR